MKCIYLIGNYMQSCNANQEAYVPSQFELREYCTGNMHKSCPHYSKAEAMTPHGSRSSVVCR
jgi:hypothetical protein